MLNKKRNIIYIVGSGFCGSTLLDLILGSSKNIYSTGELGFYNIYRSRKQYNRSHTNYLCTCKKLYRECEFWNEVNSDRDFHIRKGYSGREYLRIAAKIFFGVGVNEDEQYRDETKELLDRLDHTHLADEVEWIVDSSKDPFRLYALLQNPELNVVPILLKRDFRSIGYSYRKPKLVKHGMKKKNFYLTVFLRGFLVIFLGKRLLKYFPQSYSLSYESFCAEPQKHLDNLSEMLNVSLLSAEEITTEVDRLNHEEKYYHSIDGSGIRFGKLGKIRFQENWRGKVNRFQNAYGLFFNWLGRLFF